MAIILSIGIQGVLWAAGIVLYTRHITRQG